MFKPNSLVKLATIATLGLSAVLLPQSAAAGSMDHGGFQVAAENVADDEIYAIAGMAPPAVELGPRTITCQGINVELTQEFIDISVSNSAIISADPWGTDYNALPTYGDGWLTVKDTSSWEPATLQSQDRNLSLLRVLSDGTTMPVICNGGGVV